MTPEQQLEQFSFAYVRAVAATAGVNVYRPEVDADSVDLGFAVRSIRGEPQSPRVEAQVKAATQPDLTPELIRFPLKVKNYNDLCGDHYVPRVLVVVLVPPNVEDWLQQSEDQLALRRCGYWMSLADRDVSGNVSSVTVPLPRSQVFSTSALRQLLGMGGSS
jgi:hypothetical protein